MDLAELLSLRGVEEHCVLRSNVGFLALHGGSQDRGTREIATQAAQRAGASYYAIVQPDDLRVHLTSRHHDPAQSEQLGRFLGHVTIAISVHGFGRDSFHWELDPARGLVVEPYGPALRGRQTGPLRGIILGGRNADLLETAQRIFSERFESYRVADERIRLGFHPDNPVNLPARHGVQVELPPALRGIGDFGERYRPTETDDVATVIEALVDLAGHAARIAGPPGP